MIDIANRFVAPLINIDPRGDSCVTLKHFASGFRGLICQDRLVSPGILLAGYTSISSSFKLAICFALASFYDLMIKTILLILMVHTWLCSLASNVTNRSQVGR